MDGSKCILQVRGVRPFLSNKYDIEKHPNYKYLADFNIDFDDSMYHWLITFYEGRVNPLPNPMLPDDSGKSVIKNIKT